METTQRIVWIDELEFRDAMCPTEEVLRVKGIIPWQPYDHEQLVRHGGIVHRYTQPPRPRRPLLRDAP
jgi:hypothetical protein